MQLPVTVVLINKRIALMGMPGEPFVEFQINWRDRCPVRDAFFLGYANGYFGYAFASAFSLENPLWGGAEGAAFGVGPSSWDNPPLHPSTEGSSKTLLQYKS